METENKILAANKFLKEESLFIDLAPKVSAYILLLSVVFSILKLHFFYYLLFRVPIFQYIEISEIIMFAPESLITFLIVNITTTYYFNRFNRYEFKRLQSSKWRHKIKFLLSPSLWVFHIGLCYYMFGEVLTYGGIQNNVALGLKLILSLLPIYVYTHLLLKTNKQLELKNGKWFLMSLGLAAWLSVTDSVFSYYQLVHSDLGKMVKLKINCNTLETNLKFRYIGRTKEYWFFYDKEYHYTRIINNDTVQAAEFLVKKPSF